MEQVTGFSFLLTNKELKNLYNYLLKTINWLCMFDCNIDNKRLLFNARHQETLLFIYESKTFSNFEKRILIRMFKNLETQNHQELSYFLAIFKDRKNVCN